MSFLALSLAMIAGSQLPPLQVKGENLVDPKGKVVKLRGANLGNWFLLEMWMLGAGASVTDQYELEQVLESRFGEAEKDRLMDLYRSHWMTDRDWAVWKSYGFNLARLPLNYRMFESDAKPQTLKKDAFKWVDHAIQKAASNGAYTILDMHGIQGGQSVYDHTGYSGQNKVWTSKENQDRAAWLWQIIAKRYASNPNVVAYDLYNEPYGGTKDQQVALFKRLFPVVRKAAPKKLVLAHGNWDDFTHYGDPKANGWTNVGFQMHYYPGLFGGIPNVATHQKHFQSLEEVERRQNKVGVPFLIGEFNVVFNAAGGAEMMRRTYDLHAKNGWMSTMWSFKVLTAGGGLGDGSWGAVTNAEKIAPINFKSASKAEIEAFMKRLGTMPLRVNEPLRVALTRKAPAPALPPLPAPRTVPPFKDEVPGWNQTDVGGARAGGLRVEGNVISLFGGGDDIWAERDAFRFLHRTVDADFRLSVQVEELEETHGYAKTGLMLRDGTGPNARCILLAVWPNGTVELAERATTGGTMQGRGNWPGTLKGTRLEMERRGDTVQLWYQRSGGDRTSLGTVTGFVGKLQVGAVGLSHDNSVLGKAILRDLRLQS